ncbi:WcaF family extracellular polysaccharide biosynthesis acetyltransferase [Mangrovimonas sp. ST2L15]|uniref:WcaF family extracellular polysaccharide biosynthesis acetyltransferase n=1 Tax=Mangrovimonas sp. ST2L15 TaxID=1645916 RepID=UPI0006B50B88|nr:WcaF family extracellular polysaccharide biosynthesis acetyltransferase [Mangrovimonas sp. ST2L15]
MANKVDLSAFDNSWYQPGAGIIKRLCWYFINEIFFQTGLFPSSRLKVFFLRMFGAEVGKKVVIKPHVNIKYPWKLSIGDNSWIGERVWIDNLAQVIIGKNVCLSQGAFLLCGNHDFKKSTFDLLVGEINLEDGCWIGAKSIVGPGVVVGSYSVLTVGSIATKRLIPNMIYKGNPAEIVKERKISE